MRLCRLNVDFRYSKSMQDWGTLQLTRFASQRANNGFDYRIDNHSVFTIATRYVLDNDRFPGKVFILVLRTVTSKFLSVNFSFLTIKKNSLLTKNNLVTRWARSGEKEPTMDINHSKNESSYGGGHLSDIAQMFPCCRYKYPYTVFSR